MRTSPLILALALPACSSTAALSIDVTTGQETTALTDAAIARIDVSVTSPIDNTLKVKASATPPGWTFDLGNVSSDEQITVSLAGFSDAGGTTQVMSGSSLSGLLVSSISGDMPVFIQRSGQWARPPGGLACSHVGGVATVEENRAIVLTGGTRATGDTTCDTGAVDAYDVFGLTGLATQAALASGASVIVSILPDSNNPNSDPQGLVITASGASWVDYTDGQVTPATTPASGCSFSYADLVGGAVVGGDGGIFYVVGAARGTGKATRSVLEVDPSGNLGAFCLNTPRLGAAAAWVEGTGLVVAGGSASGTALEVLVNGSFDTPQYPADARVGGAAVATGINGSNTVLLVGGVVGGASAPTQAFDLTCGTTCMPIPYDGLALPTPVQNAAAYALSSERVLVVGEEPGAMGQTLTFVLDLGLGQNSVTPALLREPRRGATSIVSPNGAIALLGGQHLDSTGTPALSVEMFLP